MTVQDAHPALSFAEKEIRRYLLAAGLSVTDLPEIQTETGLDHAGDAYTIEATSARITVAGSNPRSVLIGAYAYLKEIGFAFYAPGEDFTRIPRITDPACLTLRKKESRCRHNFRGVCIEGAVSADHAAAYIDWLPKAGMNICFLQS